MHVTAEPQMRHCRANEDDLRVNEDAIGSLVMWNVSACMLSFLFSLSSHLGPHDLQLSLKLG